MKNEISLRDEMKFIRIGMVAVIFQIVFMIIGMVITSIYGTAPTTVIGYLEMFHSNKLVGLLRNDFTVLMLLSMYLFSFIAAFIMLRKHNFTVAFYSVLFTVIAVLLSIASHSGFSLMYLSEQYYTVTDAVQKQMILGAGEAMIAHNMWNTTSAFFSGVLLQGSGVMMCLAMIKSSKFSRITIISGILSNGFDLINHMIHFELPEIAKILLYIAGPFYIVWYIWFVKDLFLYSQNIKNELNIEKI